jgi:hypothetical protein
MSQDDAAIEWANLWNPFSMFKDLEYGGVIYTMQKQFSDGTILTAYYFSYGYKGKQHGIGEEVYEKIPIPENATIVAYLHTHGAYSGPNYLEGGFSPADIEFANYHNRPDYLSSCYGTLKCYYPRTGYERLISSDIKVF